MSAAGPRRVVLAPLVIALTMLVAQSRAVVAQQGRDVSRAVATGDATIAGVVRLDDAAQAPVRRARVTITSVDQSIGGQSATTDDRGRFAFEGLPAGRYLLQASKAAYVTSSYGATRPGRAGTPVMVSASQTIADLIIPMLKGAIITGVIQDKDGRPAPGMLVTAMQYATRNGERALVVPAGLTSQLTDDQGVYRLYGLPPGDYVVVSTLMPTAGPASTNEVREVSAADLQRALAAVRSAGATVPSPASAPAPAIDLAMPGPLMTNAPVFYPGTSDIAAASPITIAAGEERSGVSFPLLLVRSATITGTIVAPPDAPAPAPQITLFAGNQQVLDGLGLNLASARRVGVGRDGKFSITGVPPGSCTLLVRAGTGPALATPGVPTPPATMWAVQPLMVSGEDQDLTLTLQQGLTIAGRVAFAGTSAPPANMTAIQVTLHSLAGGVNLGLAPVHPSADGTFTFVGVVPGPYELVPTVVPAPWSLQSAVVDGKAATDGFFPLQQSVKDWTLTFTDRPAEVAGALQNAAGRPAPDYFVILFAADRKYWTPGSHRVMATRPGSDGKFSVRGLPPGDYYLGALTDVEPGEWFDPAFLARLVAASVKVTAIDGQVTTQNLKIGG